MERIHWVWDGRMPRRGVVVVAGEKGLGKSTLTEAYIAARVTLGELEGELYGQPMDVVIASAEDDWRSVVVPRLVAHGADLERVHRLDLADAHGDSLLTLPDDVGLVDEAIADLEASTGRKVGMLVVDPITSFLSSGIDSHKDASVRRAIAPLANLAARRDLVIVVVAHLTKDENARILSRVSGSGAFVNAARTVLAFARDPGDPHGDRGSERVLVMAASNWGALAPSLAFKMDQTTVFIDGEASVQPLLVAGGESEIGAADLQRDAPDSSNDEIADGVLDALSLGSRKAAEVKDEVSTRLRVSRRSVERAAGRLEEEGLLIRSKSGFPPIATWALATTVDASGVANGDHAVNTGDSGPPDSISDNSAGVVANGATGNRQTFVCCCATPAETDELGRCTRCYGEVAR